MFVGTVTSLQAHRAVRHRRELARGRALPRATLFFDLASPHTYLAAERADRLFAVLVAAALVGAGLPPAVLTVVLGLLVVASAVTVVQRMATVWRQSQALPVGEPR